MSFIVWLDRTQKSVCLKLNTVQQPIPAISFSTHVDSSLTNQQSFIKTLDIGKIINL